MTTKTITGTYPAGYTLKAVYYGLDIAASATVGGNGVLLTKTGLVSNYGVVVANSGTHAGVYLQNGGTVVNGAEISGYYGIATQSANPLSPVWSSIVNHGYAGGRRAGVRINEFGQLSNYGTVHGGAYGVEDNVANTGVTVRNFGYITGVSGAFLSSGGTRLYNGSATDSSALIKGTFGVTTDGPDSYVTNFGTISGSSSAINLVSSATLTNGGTAHIGLIEGARGVDAVGASTVVSNFASIIGGGGAGDFGVRLSDGGTLTNSAGATISGYAGVLVGLAASPPGGTVTNSGTIEGTGGALGLYGGYGIVFRKGGEVFNGAAKTGQAGVITGYGAVSILGGPGYVNNDDGFIGSNGVATYAVAMSSGTFINGDGYGEALGAGGVGIFGAGTVSNFGGIQGTKMFGVAIGGAGTVVNGAAKAIDEHAHIQGYAGGVICNASLTVSNFATITSADGQGVYAYQGGSVTNGSVKDTTALIAGVGGILGNHAAEMVKNFGTISGTASSGYGVDLIGGGALTNGSATDTGALISGNGGVKLAATGTVVNFGTIKGSGGPGGGYGAVLEAGANLTNGSSSDTKALIGGFGGAIVYGADTVTNFGTLAGAYGTAISFEDPGGTLVVEAGSTFIGSATGDGGTLDLASGVGKISGLFSGGDLTVSGSMAATTFFSFGIVEIGAGAQFSDTGAVSIAGGQIVTASGSLTLGGAGSNSITNAGLIEVFNGGSLDLAGAVVNTGTLTLRGGTITVSGAFSGAGRVTIAGGTLDATEAFTTSVDFNGDGGVLELADSQAYTGTVSGFSKTGTTSFDLLGIGFVSPGEATYSGTKSGGVLTVSDGTHTAHIKLTGNYLSSTFVASSNGSNGVIVVDPTAPAAPSAQSFVAAMAGMGGGAGSSPSVASGVHESWGPTLLVARPQSA